MNSRTLPKIINYSFMPDGTSFVCGTTLGFRIINCAEPRIEVIRESEEFQDGISSISKLNQTQIIAFVGTGNNPKCPNSRVFVWDDYRRKVIGEIKFNNDVKNVMIHSERLVVVLQYNIYSYALANLEKVDSIKTIPNPKGICAINYQGKLIVATVDVRPGRFIIYHSAEHSQKSYSSGFGDIQMLSMNAAGSLVGVASPDGTLVKIFKTDDGEELKTFRRGNSAAIISSIAFGTDDRFVAVSSDKMTIHVFALDNTQSQQSSDPFRELPETSTRENSASEASILGMGLSYLKDSISDYLGGEKSVAQVRLSYDNETLWLSSNASIQAPIVSFSTTEEDQLVKS